MPALVWNEKRRSLVLEGLFSVPALCSMQVCYKNAKGQKISLTLGEQGSPRALPNGHLAFSEKDIDIKLIRGAARGNGLSWAISIEPTKKSIELESITLLCGNPERWLMVPLESCKLLYNGFHSWTPSGVRSAVDVPCYPVSKSFGLMNHFVDSPFWKRRDGLLSSHVAVLADARPGDEGEKAAFLCGFLEQKNGLGEIFLQHRKSRSLLCQLDYGGRRVARGEVLISDALWVSRGRPEALLAEFADLCAAAMGAPKTFPEKSPAGWCSWYELYTEVREADVLSNLQAISEHPELGLSLLQLDDGYQPAIGDWLSRNRKFPRDLSALAHSIQNRGLKAGLWTAPFLAAPRSKIFLKHKDWMLRDWEGNFIDCGFNPMWRSRVYALDPTHPGTEQWLSEVFETLSAWGFDYFKVDFMFAGLRRGRHFEPGCSPVEAYRKGLATIRKAIGPNRFLLGCGAPIGPSIGFFDAMRISEDVKELWEENAFWRFIGRGCGVPCAGGALKNTLERAYMHRRYWINDPDCLLVRRKNSALSEPEVKTMAAVMGLSGGMMFLSDELDRLDPERLEIARAVLPPSPLGAELLKRFSDSKEGGGPRLFELKGKKRRALGVLNWTADDQNERASDFVSEDSHVYEFWRDQPIVDRGAGLSLAGHGCAVLIETPPSRAPALIGSSIHLSALVDGRIDDQFDEKSCEYVIRGRELARKSGSLWIWVPPSFVLEGHELPAGVVDARLWEGGLRLWVKAAAPWEIRLKFNRVRD